MNIDQPASYASDVAFVNCPQHIPQRFETADVEAAIESRDRRIAELEAEIKRLHRE